MGAERCSAESTNTTTIGRSRTSTKTKSNRCCLKAPSFSSMPSSTTRRTNPINPDPDQWVVFGARGVDEMSHAWVGVTYLSQEDYERLLRERTRLTSEEPR